MVYVDDMPKKRPYDQYCPIACALDVVGDRWSMLIVRELFLGPTRYGELLDALETISTDVLAKPLRELESNDVLRRQNDGSYELTAEGRNLPDPGDTPAEHVEFLYILCAVLRGVHRRADLLRALRFFRLPAIFLQVIGMTVRYTHALLRHSEETHLGKKSRTVCRTKVAAEQAWVGSRIARSWERSLHLMEEVSMAMSARGFMGEAKLIGGPWFGAPEWGLLLAVVLFCTGAHLA